MSNVTIGAINDLTIATEFLMVAVRDIAQGRKIEHPEVQQQIDWAVRKIKSLHMVPTSGHKRARRGLETIP